MTSTSRRGAKRAVNLFMRQNLNEFARTGEKIQPGTGRQGIEDGRGTLSPERARGIPRPTYSTRDIVKFPDPL